MTSPANSGGPCSEASLAAAVHAFRAGVDPERHFRLVHDCFYARVRGFFARRRLPTDADVLDLTQEVFVRVYTGLESFRGESQLGTWLFQIARNVYGKAIRSRQAQDDLVAEPAGEGTASEPTAEASPWGYEASETRALDLVLAEEDRRLLAAAIEELSPQRRTCMMLRVYQDLKVREIGEVMGLSAETVKAHLFQARQQLRLRLRDHFAEIERDDG